jgi:hypothetical protein
MVITVRAGVRRMEEGRQMESDRRGNRGRRVQMVKRLLKEIVVDGAMALSLLLFLLAVYLWVCRVRS